ncbi:hypothetical protein CVT25_003489 [Psilocybe cyanescens]|uniref:NAD(P)-binding domain-containing protein n=1 Tax=Psilocybe cyanescens TaxID=93625 RepID=A0A409WM64_PSICY|nr:hypothetical protein CVT25_003489 [Psilocybe cyanescens]
MTALITGGIERLGLSLAKLLQNANRPVIIASRSGEAPSPFQVVKFDWFDSKTFENALSDNFIDRVYIVGPPGSVNSSVIISFIDFAISKAVKRLMGVYRAEDIAQVAFETLTSELSSSKDILVVGPELHLYVLDIYHINENQTDQIIGC